MAIITSSQLRDKIGEFGACITCSYRYTERLVSSVPQITSLPKENHEIKLDKQIEIKTCSICLGLLQGKFIEDSASKIKEMIGLIYDCPSYMLAITLPSSLYIREHCLTLYLKSEYPEVYENAEWMPYLNVKEVWRYLVSSFLRSTLNKHLNTHSPLIITINTLYVTDTKECRSLALALKQRNRKDHFSNSEINRLLESVQQISSLVPHLPVPPSIPFYSLTFDKLSVLRESIFCAGRYNKWSRVLPQTAWILDGERKLESSVQEIITTKLEPAFKAEGSKFSSSGREDVDVRTLGKGRPFVIELLNPHVSYMSEKEMRNIENSINESAFDLIYIKDLQIVSRDKLIYLKQGEESKTKEYCAFCIIYGDVTKKSLENCCKSAPFVIKQKTPIRVLHRRTVAIREKTIHSIKINGIDTKSSPGNTLLKLNLMTQAGTYIKEFIHGDFGRTIPNLSTMLNNIPVDVVALDVVHIEMDWPPAVKY